MTTREALELGPGTADELAERTGRPRCVVRADLAVLVFDERVATAVTEVLRPEGKSPRLGETRLMLGDPSALLAVG